MPNSWIFAVYLVRRAGQFPSSQHFVAGASRSVLRWMCLRIFFSRRSIGARFWSTRPLCGGSGAAGRFPEFPYPDAPSMLRRLQFFNADLGLATVRAEHRSFYRGYSCMRPLPNRAGFLVFVKPICLMAVDFPASREKVFARFPFLRSSAFERRMLFERRAGDRNSWAHRFLRFRSRDPRSFRGPESGLTYDRCTPTPPTRVSWCKASHRQGPVPSPIAGPRESCDFALRALFTLAPHLQLINHRGRFFTVFGI